MREDYFVLTIQNYNMTRNTQSIVQHKGIFWRKSVWILRVNYSSGERTQTEISHFTRNWRILHLQVSFLVLLYYSLFFAFFVSDFFRIIAQMLHRPCQELIAHEYEEKSHRFSVTFVTNDLVLIIRKSYYFSEINTQNPHMSQTCSKICIALEILFSISIASTSNIVIFYCNNKKRSKREKRKLSFVVVVRTVEGQMKTSICCFSQ